MPDFIFTSNGGHGEDGSRGMHGHSGGGPGGHGERGGKPRPGTNAGPVKVVLKTVKGKPSMVQVHGKCWTIPEEKRILRARDLGVIHVSAIGGDGGRGGVGGDGGQGQQGFHGFCATQFSCATDGQRGFDGGNGGTGTDGGKGTDGGSVVITAEEKDAYLFMSVAGATNPGDLIRGGRGGPPGRHGFPGMGGMGGMGGSACFWTDGNGNSYSNPGGRMGPSGKMGRLPHTILQAGQNGHRGSFSFAMSLEMFKSRFDLQIHKRLRVHEFGHHCYKLDGKTPDLKPDGIFEFGQMCYVSGVTIKNRGGMPTPSQQRQRIIQGKSKWVRPLKDSLFTGDQDTKSPFSLLRGETEKVEGYLFFQLGMVNCDEDDVDFDPIVVQDYIYLRCFQLGNETDESHGAQTEYQREFEQFSDPKDCPLTIEFPAQNLNGFCGLSSLSRGEGSGLHFPIFNKSSLPLGTDSGNGYRGVGVHITMAQHCSIRPEDIEFLFVAFTEGDVDVDARKCSGQEVESSLCCLVQPQWCQNTPQISNGIEGVFRGTFFPIPHIAPNSVSTIEMKIMLKNAVDDYQNAQLQAELLLEDLYEKQWRVVQRRAHAIRCEPVFDMGGEIDAILVTTSATTHGQYEQWRHILSDVFDLKFSVYSVTRYGRFGPRESAEPEISDKIQHLLEHVLPNTLVVVLDDTFEVRRGVTTSGSQQALEGWCTRNYRGLSWPVERLKIVEPSNMCESLPQRVGLAGPSYLIVSPMQTQPFESNPVLSAIKRRIPAPKDVQLVSEHSSVGEFKKDVMKHLLLLGDIVETADGANVVVAFDHENVKCKSLEDGSLVRCFPRSISVKVSPTNAHGSSAVPAQWIDKDLDPMSARFLIRVQRGAAGKKLPEWQTLTRWMQKAAVDVRKFFETSLPQFHCNVVECLEENQEIELVKRSCFRSIWYFGDLNVFLSRRASCVGDKHAQVRMHHMVPEGNAGYDLPDGPGCGWKTLSLRYAVAAALTPEKQLQRLGIVGDEVVACAMLKNILSEFVDLVECGHTMNRKNLVERVFHFMPTLCLIVDVGSAGGLQFCKKKLSPHRVPVEDLKQMYKCLTARDSLETKRRAAYEQIITGVVAMTEGVGMRRRWSPLGIFERYARAVHKVTTKMVAKTLLGSKYTVDHSTVAVIGTEIDKLRKASRCCSAPKRSWEPLQRRFSPEGFHRWDCISLSFSEDNPYGADIRTLAELEERTPDESRSDTIYSRANFVNYMQAAVKAEKKSKKYQGYIKDDRATLKADDYKAIAAPIWYDSQPVFADEMQASFAGLNISTTSRDFDTEPTVQMSEFSCQAEG